MNLNRRDILKAAAASSALAALGLPAQALASAKTRWVKSVCRYCGTGCGLYVGVEDGKVTAVRGDPDNHNKGLLCLKGFLLPQILRAPDRAKHPLIRKNGELVQASWDEALELVARKFREAVDVHGPQSVAFYGSGQGLTEETYAANKLFKAGLRSNNVEGNPRLCMASAVGGYTTTFGKDEPMGLYEDMDHADVFFIIGSNTAEAHPVLFQRIVRRKEKDPNVKVIVVDPRRTHTARIADLHIGFTPGIDVPILNAMAHVLVRDGLVDETFIATHTLFGEGKDAGNKTWADYKAFVAEWTPERAAQLAGCRAEDIVTAAHLFGDKTKRTTSLWCMGVNQRTQGVWANNLIHNLHLITGKIGLPGSTPLSLTGQPNACGGVRDGGALSHLLPYGRVIANEKHREEMERLWKVPKGTLNPAPGLPTMDLFSALGDGKIKCMYVMTTNPGQSLPNLNKVRGALAKPDKFLVVAEAYHPTRTSEFADVVLPAALWAEKEGVYGCTERRYQLLEKAVEPVGEARPDFDIFVELARRLGHGDLLPWKTPADAWTELIELARGTAYDFSGMTRPALQQSHGLIWPLPQEGHPGTRRRYVRGDDPLVPADHPERIKFYGRPDGRAVIWLRGYKPAAEVTDAEYPLWLTTGRALEQWHTATMTSKCKELARANLLTHAELNPLDAAKLGVRDGDAVKVSSRRGSSVYPVKTTDSVAPGIVYMHMHDPDHMVNWLTSDAVDAASRQPEYKVAAVKVEKVAAS